MRITPIRAVVEPKIAPTIRAPLGITSGFAQGLGQLGQAVGDVGQVAQEIGLRKKYFDDTTSLSNLTNKFKVSIADHLGLMQATAYDDMDKEHKDGMAEIRLAGADEAAKVNPEVSANWKKLWNTLEADTNIKFGRIYREKFRQNGIAGLFNLVHSIEDDIVTATIEQDGEKTGLLYQYINNYIDEIRRELMLPALQAEALKEGLKNAVEIRVKAAEREAIKQQEKQVITGAWLGITEEARDPLTGKTDYTKAYELLSKPGTLKRS